MNRGLKEIIRTLLSFFSLEDFPAQVCVAARAFLNLQRRQWGRRGWGT